MKRIAPGFYEDSLLRKGDQATVRVTYTRTEDGKEWYYEIGGGSAEDMFPTLRAAEAAAKRFLEVCVWSNVYGWVMPYIPAAAEPAESNATAPAQEPEAAEPSAAPASAPAPRTMLNISCGYSKPDGSRVEGDTDFSAAYRAENPEAVAAFIVSTAAEVVAAGNGYVRMSFIPESGAPELKAPEPESDFPVYQQVHAIAPGFEVDPEICDSPEAARRHGDKLSERYTRRGFPYRCVGAVYAEERVDSREYPRDGRSADWKPSSRSVRGYRAVLEPLCDPTAEPAPGAITAALTAPVVTAIGSRTDLNA